MEQHRTRPPQPPARPRRTAPLPPQGSRSAESAVVYRAASRPGRPVPPFVRKLRALPLYRTLRGMPNPRLTGLGSGLFCAATMFLLGCLLWLLFGSSVVAYGVLFVPVSVLTALWVRPADLVTAPIAVPIAFAVGLIPVSGGNGGFGGHFMSLITSLALEAGWLYAGTLAAGLVVAVRRIKLMGQRRRARAAGAGAGAGASRPPRGPKGAAKGKGTGKGAKRRMPTA